MFDSTGANDFETKKYKSSVDFKITSFTNNDAVKTTQAFDTPKKAAITNEGKTLLSVNLSGETSSFFKNDESSFLSNLKFKKPIQRPTAQA